MYDCMYYYVIACYLYMYGTNLCPDQCIIEYIYMHNIYVYYKLTRISQYLHLNIK